MSTTTDDFLFGGGNASAKFEEIGESITGQVISTEVRQQTDLATGNPLTWDNGDARMQLVVTLATALKDDADDDGKRSIYIKGSKKAGSQSLHDAVAQAVRAAGAKGLESDGTLTVTFTGEEPSQTRGFNPRKLYSASYAKPDHAAATGGFLNTDQGQVDASTGEIAPKPEVQAASAPEQPVGPTPAQLAAMKAAGIDPSEVFGKTG